MSERIPSIDLKDYVERKYGMTQRYAVPEGMLKAACDGLPLADDSYVKTVLEAALRWLSKNPILPTWEQVFVVEYVQDCDNGWISAVFSEEEHAKEWIRNKQKDDDEYSVCCGGRADTENHYRIEPFEVRESSDYTMEDIEGLKVNYEGVLKKKGFIPAEGSNYRKVFNGRGDDGR